MIADVVALYVDPRGLYPQRFAKWCWYDERRDAREYDGPLPVVAHPPCQRWCRLAGLVEARWGLKRGDDGGLFEHALSEVRRCGGVLEHPAYSDAAGAHPGEWTCYVEQWRYGHRAKKATWLYYCGAARPFDLDFGVLSHAEAAGRRPRLTKKQARSTPPAFLDVLVALARGAT